MYRKDGQLIFSPTDLTTYWESAFASWMDRFDLENPGQFARDEADGLMKVLQAKGYDHEAATIAGLTRAGKSVFRIDNKSATAREQTLAAMARGEEIIFQARLECGQFRGWADFLVRVDGKSLLGDYHYEVWDTKLATKLKPYYLIQLCAYAQMLELDQGICPEHVAVVLGNGEHRRMRLHDYFFYFMSVKANFLTFQKEFAPDRCPDPEKYRSFGRWGTEAARIIEQQDALIQVAGLNMNQAKNLKAAGIATMTSLAEATVTKVPKMAEAVFARLQQQAKLQLASQGEDRPSYVVRSDNARAGLYLLPHASDGDVFFDIEGFPVMEGGLEYLWGNTYLEGDERKFQDFWAHSREEEKTAFQGFIDWVYGRWKKWPDMHIYHYAQYEISAIRRMMGNFATREHEVDELLRNEVFVDLYNVVRHGLIVGEPRYSIKNIERLYRGAREGEVKDGGASVEAYEAWRSDPDGKTWRDSAILKSIREYNIDDCDSTLELACWLRNEQAKAGIPAYQGKGLVVAPEPIAEDLPELQEMLIAAGKKHPEGELLAHLLDFYWRESKPAWWRFFERLGSLPEELFDDPDCLALLTRYTEPEPFNRTTKRCVYQFDPEQECKVKGGDDVVNHFDEKMKFKIEDIDCEQGFVALVGNAERGFPETLTLIPMSNHNTKVLVEAVLAFCRSWLEDPQKPRAITDFLRRNRPRLKGRNERILNPEAPLIDDVIDCVLSMDHTTLCIQGPPGTGKTYTAEHVIAALVERGFRVGVASNSHKAINNLFVRSAKLCDERGIAGDFVKVTTHEEPELLDSPRISKVKSASKLNLSASIKAIGGVAWTFAAGGMRDEVDYLFVDEAGQVSIANLVAMAQSCRNIILMGDQMQLSQPIQGAHPGESGKSILDYYLQDHATIPDDLGVFLPLTYRMHPTICKFISEAVYEGRLKSIDSCAQQSIDLAGIEKASAGIFFRPVVHSGNSQAADEEVLEIKLLVQKLLGRSYTDCNGAQHKLTLDHILVVAPYNLQVRKLKEALGDDAQVGSVDKFQGQEAPVVILSMCCSDAASSYRGIEFLFSKNRLNVAISRAQIAAFVVGHPGLVTTHVSNATSMAMVNMFCRLVGNEAGTV